MIFRKYFFLESCFQKNSKDLNLLRNVQLQNRISVISVHQRREVKTEKGSGRF